MHHYIDRPDVLLKQVWNDSNILIVQKQTYLNNDKFCLIDISLNSQGNKQQKIYLDSYFYRTNIRKGNTLIQTFTNNSKSNSKIHWGRKGMQKNLDIKLQYLESITLETNLHNKNHKKQVEVIFRSNYIFNQIYLDVLKNFLNGKRVQLLKTQKVNGLNAQISYFYDLNAWIISSKNISLMAQSVNDLDIFSAQKYYQAKVIAKQWFQEIKNFNKQQIKKLKKQLDGFTLIGQYCGHPQFQHLIKYDQIQIIWFSLVDNFSDNYCIDPYQVKKKVQQFGFKFVKIKRAGSFNDKAIFFKALQQLYLKTAQASLQDSQNGMEGSIVYFVSPQIKGNLTHAKVLGSGKLKTIQFQFFNLMQKKLIRFINKKQNQSQILQKYQQECKIIQQYCKKKAKYPLSYYIKILKSCCDLIHNGNMKQEFLRTQFFSLIKLTFYMISKNISISKYGQKLLKNNQFLEQVCKIPLQTYDGLNCSQKIIFIPISLPQITQNSLASKIQKHFKKINLGYKIVQKQEQFENEKREQIIQKIFIQINEFIPNNDQPLLFHFYLNLSLQCAQIYQLYDMIQRKGYNQIYHKFVFVSDLFSEESSFSQNSNTYPFKIQTIIFSYYLVYRKYYNTPTIQQKISQLQKVTIQLKKRRNFMDNILNKRIKKHQSLLFTKNIIIQSQNKSQIAKFITDILSGQKQYQNYCRLILKLQKLYKNAQNKLINLSEEQIHQQVEKLIKNSFPEIPLIKSI